MLGDEGGGNLVPFDQGLGPIGALLHASHCGSVQLRQLGGGEFYNGVFLQQLVLLLEEDQLVASSSSRSLAPWDRAAAMASFIFMPREKSLNCLVRGMSKRVR